MGEGSMRILGLIGSARRLGNTEALVKEALLGAQEAGAQAAVEAGAEAGAQAGAETGIQSETAVAVSLLRLTDLNIKPCRGCMSCVFGDGTCAIKDDDMPYLLDLMLQADGVIIGAPTYILSPAAIIKLITDRFLMAAPRIREIRAKKRYAATINVAGLPSWDPFGSSMLNMFALAFQFDLVDSVTAFSPGPGETLLDPKNIEAAHAAGRHLVEAAAGRGKKAGFASGEGVTGAAGAIQGSRRNVCPVCGNVYLAISPDGKVACPICEAEGWLVTGNATGNGPVVGDLTVEFPASVRSTNRWAEEPLIRHVNDWIIASKDTYREKRPAIKELLQKYQRLNDWWVKRD